MQDVFEFKDGTWEKQWLSGTSNRPTAWNSIHMHILGSQHRPPETEILGVGLLPSLRFWPVLRWSWCKLKFENQCCRGFLLERTLWQVLGLAQREGSGGCVLCGSGTRWQFLRGFNHLSSVIRTSLISPLETPISSPNLINLPRLLLLWLGTLASKDCYFKDFLPWPKFLW